MGIFNWEKRLDPEGGRTYVTSYKETDLLQAMDARLMVRVLDELAKKIAKDIYPEVLKSIDKKLIVEEVSTQVSKKVLEGIFSKDKK